MAFAAKVILDSLAPCNRRLITVEATYPRFIHCYDDQTEVLSEVSGVRKFRMWSEVLRLYDQIPLKLAAYSSGSIHFERPSSIIASPYYGPMISCRNHRLSFCVTPDHRMYVGCRKSKGDVWGVVKASSLIACPQRRLATTGLVTDGRDIGNKRAELIGFFVGDGSRGRKGQQIHFHLKKSRKITYLHGLLTTIGIEFDFRSYQDDVTNTVFPSSHLPEADQCYVQSDWKKTIPPCILASTPENMESFLLGFWNADGYAAHEGMYSTGSKYVADRLSALGAMCGTRINVTEPNEQGGYILAESKKETSPIIRRDKNPPQITPYNGMVYCGTVSTGLLLVRHNGLVMVSGNSEIMTHRDRARNAASSRAIPFPAMCERITADPVAPIRWGLEQGGMVQGGELPPILQELAERIWLTALTDAMFHARHLFNIGKTVLQLMKDYHTVEAELPQYSMPLDWYERVEATANIDTTMRVHKSLPNRIVEPWMWITVVMTATEWKNFFRLRCHPDAEVHFQKIAGMLRDAIDDSKPIAREWHRPYVSNLDEDQLTYRSYTISDLNRISAARCARVSYLTHDGKRDPKKDIDLFEKLSTGSGFGHWSPMEHVAQASSNPKERSGPFVGWKQFRKEFPLENLEG